MEIIYFATISNYILLQTYLHLNWNNDRWSYFSIRKEIRNKLDEQISLWISPKES